MKKRNHWITIKVLGAILAVIIVGCKGFADNQYNETKPLDKTKGTEADAVVSDNLTDEYITMPREKRPMIGRNRMLLI